MTAAIHTTGKYFLALAAINNAPFVDERDLRNVDRRLLDVYRADDAGILRTRAGKLLNERGYVIPIPGVSGPGPFNGSAA
jgi:hypothetical protein